MNILVTRPSPAGEQLVQQLLTAGLSAWHMPLIDFLPGRELIVLPVLLQQLRPQDLLFILSPRVVEFASQPLQALRQQPAIQLFAPGTATALAVQQICGLIATYPPERGDSEAILALPALQQIAGRRALILRGNGGRELLANSLAERGAQIRFCECYQRHKLAWQRNKQANYEQQQPTDTLVVTSGEMLNQLVGQIPADQQRWLFACKLVVVSERLAYLARQHGWQDILIANNADNATLLRLLQSISKRTLS